MADRTESYDNYESFEILVDGMSFIASKSQAISFHSSPLSFSPFFSFYFIVSMGDRYVTGAKRSAAFNNNARRE